MDTKTIRALQFAIAAGLLSGTHASQAQPQPGPGTTTPVTTPPPTTTTTPTAPGSSTVSSPSPPTNEGDGRDDPSSYFSLVGDASGRTGGVTFGAGGGGFDLQTPAFGLYVAGQLATAPTVTSDNAEKLRNAIAGGSEGTGVGIADFRLTPFGNQTHRLGIRARSTVTSFRLELVRAGGNLKSDEITNVTWRGSAVYLLNVIELAREAKLIGTTDQSVLFAVELGGAGRTLAGDLQFVHDILGAGAGTYGAVELDVALYINQMRLFVNAPWFLSDTPGFNKALITVGAGVRGDLLVLGRKKSSR